MSDPFTAQDFLDSNEFRELMQAYRHAYVVDQVFVNERFEAVKAFVRERMQEALHGARSSHE